MPEVRLEQLELSHSHDVYSLVDSNREHLREWLPWVDGVESEEDTTAFLQSAMKQEREGRGTHYAVFYRGSMAGVAGFHPVDWPNRNTEIGYWLAEEFTGRGIVSSACRRLLSIAFMEMKLNRVEIRCASGNHASAAVALRLGMVYEGTLREEEWLHCRYVDHCVYSILKREYSGETDQ